MIDGTIDSIFKKGFSGTTLVDIAKQAGLSHGLVNFHFDSKEALFAETLRQLAEEYRQVWREVLAKAGSNPFDRLKALVDANLDPRVCNPRSISVWYAFWGEAATRPAYHKICSGRDAEYREALLAACRAATESGKYKQKPGAVAEMLDIMTDGLWLTVQLDPGPKRMSKLQTATATLLETLYPRHFPRPE
ncbi:MAG: TetR family transcriptional regulator C-terminal domain-containing protein [Hyphomicrobium sp.]